MLKKIAYFVVAGFVYSHIVEPFAKGFVEGVCEEWPNTKARFNSALHPEK